jgi:hypothetical protein
VAARLVPWSRPVAGDTILAMHQVRVSYTAGPSLRRPEIFITMAATTSSKCLGRGSGSLGSSAFAGGQWNGNRVY